MTNKLIFWFDPASSYSYIAAMRIDDAAKAAGVEVEWRPFLLGPIFKAQGMDTSPFAIYPLKGRYMLRDMDRLCEDYGIPFTMPGAEQLKAFPRNSLLAARASIVALKEPWGRDFVRSIYKAEYSEWADISDPALIGRLVAEQGGDPQAFAQKVVADETKAELRANTDEAASLGLFGAPSFTLGNELFWGSDRIDQAVARAARQAA